MYVCIYVYSIVILYHKATLIAATGILLPFSSLYITDATARKRKKQLIKFAQFSCRKSEQPGLLSKCVTYIITLVSILRKASLLV